MPVGRYVKPGPVPRGLGIPRPVQTKFPFYRCRKCHRVITYLQERAVFKDPESEKLNVCPCGARTYSPTNLVGLEHILPRVLWFRLLNAIYDY